MPVDFVLEHKMNKLFLAGAAALLMTTGAAMAQTTSTSQTTTTTIAPPVDVMPTGSPKFATPNDALGHEGTVSVTRTLRTIGPDGAETDTSQTTWPNSNGVADDSVTRTTTYPALPPVVTTTTTTSSSSVSQ
jgi:hypothetical protein